MSLQPNPNRDDYIGNGGVDTYNYNFRIYDKSELKVLVRDTSDVVSELVVDTDFTVSGEGDPDGGSIVLLAGNLTLNYVLTVLGRSPIEQQNNIGNDGEFYPEVIEEQFDKLAIIDQQQQEQIGRSLKIPESILAADFDPTLPIQILDPLYQGSAVIVNPTNDGFTLGDSGTGAAAAVAADLATHIADVANPHVVTKAQVGLANADNTSDLSKPISTATQTALNLKANLASPALTGVPTTPTAAPLTGGTQIASQAYVDAAVTAGGGGGGGTLPPLNISANTTITAANKFYFCDVSGGGFTVTLPLAASFDGEEYVVKNISFGSLNNVSIARSGADLIEGGTSDTLTAGEERRYVSNGIEWYIV